MYHLKYLSPFIVSLILIGCGGEPVLAPTAGDVNVPTLSFIGSSFTNQGVVKTLNISAHASNGEALTYTLISDPVNKVTGSVSGTTLTLTPDINYSGTATLTLTASNGAKDTSKTFTLTVVENDPLYQYQWHLNNSGQTNFASSVGIASEDINVDCAIAAGYTGKGVVVAIVDEGLEIAHEDLSANMVVNGSWDFVGNDLDPTNQANDGDHGTSVAGLLASVGWNGVGGRGVAPSASLKGFNLIKNQLVSNYVSALGGASYSFDVDIFNQSYGSSPISSSTLNTTVEAQYLSGVTSLRGGKGAVYIKSGGNGFYKRTTINDVVHYCSSIYGQKTVLSCQNTNMDPSNSIPYNIIVGALTAKGKKSSYSTAGSSLWISAPGGEYGVSEPAMMTTDQSGCSRGRTGAYGHSYNRFNSVSAGTGHSENLKCNYDSTMSGTSSSAPILSGAVALMLEANPSLTWRDVKHILANTSDQVDPGLSATTINVNGALYMAEPAWVTNSAGYKFHNYYGFGRVNVGAAINAAKSYSQGSLGNFSTTSWVNSASLSQLIPDNSATGLSTTLSVNNHKVIEAVQVKINILHRNSGVIAIELTSPSGTKSMLLNPLNAFGGSDDLTNFVMLSNAFYGESSTGNWTIKVVDSHPAADVGTLENWSIRIFGH